MTRRLLLIFLSLYFLGPPLAGAEGDPSKGIDLGATAMRLADPATQEEALLVLEEHPNPSARTLLTAMKEGAVYRWGEKVAIFGVEGDLLDVNGKPLLDEQGRPVPIEQLGEAVALDERHYPLLQRILNQLDLFSEDRSVRRSAAYKLGSLRDPSLAALFASALAKEQDPEIEAILKEAAARVQLLAPDSPTRAAAARFLGQRKSEAALPGLKLALEREKEPAVMKALQGAVKQIESFIVRRNLVGYLFNGVSLGSVLLLMSLGLAITFGLMGIINMAHGEMLMIGAYTAYVVQEIFTGYFPGYQDYYFLLALPLSFVAAGAVGWALEGSILRFLYGKPLETLIVTWGIGMVLQQSARLYFGDQTSVNSPTWFRGGWEVMRGLIFPWSRISIVALSVAALVMLYWLFYRTYAGLKVRAVMQNRAMASSLGISTRRVDSLTFALGTAIAGIAGCALSLIGTVDPEVGKTYIVDSFMVVVLGGVGKLLGAVAASFGIGLTNKMLEPAIGGTAAAIYAKVAILAVVIWFLQWKPTGLFPAKGRVAESE